MKIFRDRREAGRALARLLLRYKGDPYVIVLALPRGGVPVGYEVAHALDAPLEVLPVRKLGAPGHEELAVGAIASGGARFVDRRELNLLGITEGELNEIEERETEELRRREALYRDDATPLELRGKIVILVDDGLATGATMRAALTAVERMEPTEIVIAAPVASRDVCERLTNERPGACCICRLEPDPLRAVGLWYEDFSPTSDEEVLGLLELRAREIEARFHRDSVA